MIDMISIIHSYLIRNDAIDKHCRGRIKFYDYPETAEADAPHILISPIGSPMPDEFGSNKELTTNFVFQIDVRGRDRKLAAFLQDEIKKVMWSIGFYTIGGTDQYDSELDKFLNGRRYEGEPYTNEEVKHIDTDIAHIE